MGQRFRTYSVILLIAVGASLVADLLWRQRSDGLSVDLLYLTSRLLDRQTAADGDRTAIIAIDEETYRQEPFKRTPAVSWTPEIATVLDAVLDGGAKVIGLDIINSQSLHYVGDLFPADSAAEQVFHDYDRDLLRTLSKGGRAGRIVMSYTMQGGTPIAPNAQQIMAVGGGANLRPTNMETEPDGIIRRGLLSMPTAATGETDQPIATLPLELYARGGDHRLAFAADGRPTIDGEVPAGIADNSLLINFRPVSHDPPIYSLADLYACAQQGKTDFFKQQFANRTVILGTVLDIEDRRLTSKRFATNAMGRNYAAWCALQPTPGLFNDHASAFIPGSYILAAIVDNLRQQNWLRPAPESLRLPALFLLALLGGLMVLRLRATAAIVGLLLLASLWPAFVIVAFQQELVLPLVAGWIALGLGILFNLIYRTAIIDRSRRLLRRSFSLYFPRVELDRLMSQEQMPALGGELRPVTILFSDIASYSTLSEDLAPADLVADLNRYFGRMTEIVQHHGGFVDKFIGDGILAVFGAPLADADHALAGVRAALEMCDACEGDPLMTISGQRFGIRIGIHSGDAIVGNIGAPDRFNYTVVGDSVNLASRLEGVGKRYHTTIIVSEQTRQLIGERLAFRELDMVRVVGRDHPVRLFVPLTDSNGRGYDERQWMLALSAWRNGDFAGAAAICEKLRQQGDEIAASFADRAQQWLKMPPANWTGIVNLSEK